MKECREELRRAGGAYPKSCPACGLAQKCPRTTLPARETPLTITAWADATFGPALPHQVAARMGLEVAELTAAIATVEQYNLPDDIDPDQLDAICLEVADVNIMLCQLAGKLVMSEEELDAFAKYRAVSPQPPYQAATSLGKVYSHLMDNLASATHVPFESWTPTRRGRVEELVKQLRTRVGIVADSLDLNLQAVTNRKMRVNREREWIRLETGRMQHK